MCETVCVCGCVRVSVCERDNVCVCVCARAQCMCVRVCDVHLSSLPDVVHGLTLVPVGPVGPSLVEELAIRLDLLTLLHLVGTLERGTARGRN